MKRFEFIATGEDVGEQVKKVLRRRYHFSSRFMTKIKYNDLIRVNGEPVPGWTALCEGDVVLVLLPEERNAFTPEDIPLEILYEDDDFLTINKQAGLTVHPTKGHPDHTAANAIMKYIIDTNQNFKIRFVNRLDMDTTGVLLIAKNSHAQAELIKQMANGMTEKRYTAVVSGTATEDDFTIDSPIGLLSDDSPLRGVKPVSEGGQESLTEVHVRERFDGGSIKASLLDINLLTGRTHQIRVHLSSVGLPIIGDPLYGDGVARFPRQALHASSFSFIHPTTKERLTIEAPLPEDMVKLVDSIRRSGSDSDSDFAATD